MIQVITAKKEGEESDAPSPSGGDQPENGQPENGGGDDPEIKEDPSQDGSGEESDDDGEGDSEGDGDDAEDTGDGEGDEETVTIKKSELDKIKSDRDHYRTGMIVAKRGGRNLPGSQPKKKEGEGEGDADGDLDGDGTGEESKYATKEELKLNNEKQAIALAAQDQTMPGLDEYWDEIVTGFDPDTSRESVLDVQAGIRKAYDKWAKKNPDKAKGSQTQPGTPGKKATADLASDTDVKTGKDKTPKAPRRRIIPKSSKMGDWFGKTPQEKKGE